MPQLQDVMNIAPGRTTIAPGSDTKVGSATTAVHEAVTGGKWDRRRETRNLGTKIDKDRCSELLLL